MSTFGNHSTKLGNFARRALEIQIRRSQEEPPVARTETTRDPQPRQPGSGLPDRAAKLG
jgi:hypothetical protein